MCQFHVVDESTRVAVVIAERVAQLAFLVATGGDGAVVQVYTGVNGFEGRVDDIAFLLAPDGVVAHTQRDDLLIVEYVLNDDNTADMGSFVFLCFWGTDAYAELLSAVGALKYQ